MNTNSISHATASLPVMSDDASFRVPTPHSAPMPAAATATAPATKSSKSKPRKRVNTAEKRNQHNAIERARRETLNGRFLTLAGHLPQLANQKRPSKSAIVNGSIGHLKYSRDQRLLAANLLRTICKQHEDLLKEVNSWRATSRIAPHEYPSAWSDEIEQICGVEKEVFGTFNDVNDGDDDNEFDNDDSLDQMSMDNGSRPATGLTQPPAPINFQPESLGQSMQGQHPMFGGMPPPHPVPTVNGLNWSQDFMNMGAHGNNSGGGLDFNAFITELDRASSQASQSPSNSNGGNVITPPNSGTIDTGVFTHQTPSPRSTQSVPLAGNRDETKAPQPTIPPQDWAAAQAHFFQQQQQHHGRFNQPQMTPGGMPFGRPQGPFGYPMNGQIPTQLPTTDGQTDQAAIARLIASVYNDDGKGNNGQIEAWRRTLGAQFANAGDNNGQMGNGNPSPAQIQVSPLLRAQSESSAYRLTVCPLPRNRNGFEPCRPLG